MPGDGCCGPNCAAALLFGDEIFGPKLRRRMNLFFAKHWHTRYQYISQWSEGHPYIRKLKDGHIRHTNPEELIQFLTHSYEAAFMWSDSEDLSIIADMYQIRIKVITTKGLDDPNPSVNWIYPCSDLKQFSELKNVELSDMVLMHENDSHFNLIVNDESDLVKFGNLSQIFAVGPNEEEKEDTKACDSEEEAVKEQTGEKKSELVKLKQELKKCKESKDILAKEYVECEKELRIKTEELEKSKIEVKDLRKIVKLRNELQDKNIDLSFMDIDEGESVDDLEVLLKAKNKGFSRQSPQTEAGGRTNKNEETGKSTKEFTCTECGFKAPSENELRRHTNMKHQRKERSLKEEEFNCMNCDFQGYDRDQLKNTST